MKKISLLLTASALLLTSCDMNSILSKLADLDSDNQDVSFDEGDDSSYENRNPQNSSTPSKESIEDRIYNKIQNYILTNGFYYEATVNGQTYNGGAKGKIYFYNSGDADVYLDLTSTPYMYIQEGDSYMRTVVQYDVTTAFTLAFNPGMSTFQSMQDSDLVSKATVTSETYLNQACKVYRAREDFGATMYNEYTWYVSEKDQFTLKYVGNTISSGEIISSMESVITKIEYSFNPEIPTNFVDLGDLSE